MSLKTKLISGNDLRKSRIHDEKGNLTSWENIIFHAPPAIASGILRITVGYRPVLPWIGYTTINHFKTFLSKNSRVLEFGSGMSTLWYSNIAGQVYSVEDNFAWYKKISELIGSKKIDNITYRFAENAVDYYTFMADDEYGFDLIVVDGSYRSKCISHVTKLVKPGGILYLDDSDKDSSVKGGDMRTAENLARNFANKQGAQITEITDFSPNAVFC